LIQKYGVSNEQLKKAIHESEKLNLNRVVPLLNNKITENVVPDFCN
jgi:RNA polymerase sigma-54 factor